jgi:AcrR family transcriptional regulator
MPGRQARRTGEARITKAGEKGAAGGKHGSIGYLNVGRINQKLRTRDALVSVASDLLRAGEPVSVSAVADAARVSRTTAYRYFPTSEMLAAQAALAIAASLETRQLDAVVHGAGSASEKLDAVVTGIDSMVRANEAAFRAVLRLSLGAAAETGLPTPRRTPIRRLWLEAALAELRPRLDRRRFDRLLASLSLLCGVEPDIVLRDIVLMSPDDALAVKRWAARALLEAAMAEAPEPGRGKAEANG